MLGHLVEPVARQFHGNMGLQALCLPSVDKGPQHRTTLCCQAVHPPFAVDMMAICERRGGRPGAPRISYLSKSPIDRYNLPRNAVPKEVNAMEEKGTYRVKSGLAEMLKGGVIMDVTTAEQATIAEAAGAVAVMALERVPADIRAHGGVARMADPGRVREIMAAVSIPVMAKVRIGHFAEAQILESLGVDYIDESEVLTPADPAYHVNKWDFTVPFVCGARNLGEACRRLAEGAAMIRTKGEPGTGNVIEAVRHMRIMNEQIRDVLAAPEQELMTLAKELGAPYEMLLAIRDLGRLPVVNFAAGGIATPADAALMMQLGCDGIFVGSGVFKSGDPERRARALVEATTHFEDAAKVAAVSEDLGEAMSGTAIELIPEHEMMQTRGT